tara:strand:+ start:1686 stop:2084 length:399 start_codon:yes stop_codon:yes gene_type:complete
MPKPKPDQVIRHEIVLSRPLQDTVDGLVGSKQFNNIADPVVALMSDVSGMAVFLTLVAALGLTGPAFKLILQAGADVDEVLTQFVLQSETAKNVQRNLDSAEQKINTTKTGVAVGLNTLFNAYDDFKEQILE